MPSKGRYTAGKQVSRWEADSENIDIEYKNLEGQQQGHICSNCTCPFGDRKPLIIKILTVITVFGMGLVIGFLVRKTVYKDGDMGYISEAQKQTGPSTDKGKIYGIKQDYDREFSRLIQDDLEDLYNYEDHMKIITKCVHISGLGSANKLLDYVQNKWKTFPFDAVKMKKYNVTLSYANYTNMDANKVTVHRPDDYLMFQSQYNMSSSHPEYLPFNAYAPSGKVSTANLVYAHFGRREDFEELKRHNVSVNGSLLIMRYGRIHPASQWVWPLMRHLRRDRKTIPLSLCKVRNAEVRGALGVILYSDPADYTNNQSSVYPDTWWLPGWAVQLSHVRYDLIGDPLTPDYSSITGINNIPKSKAKLPRIPVQPIRYDDAKYLLTDMNGPIVKNEWFGGLNVTYRMGPGYRQPRTVTLQVQNLLQHRIISNILATIKGHYEADKYVIVGAHIDSWIQGGVDSGTGYTVIQELARTFTYHIGKGWRPRRTIIFALWDASKYGHIGAYEWVQEYERQLVAGAVAYINLDTLIQGNYSFTSSATSILQSVVMAAAETVELNCSATDGPCDTNSSVYEQWLKSFPTANRSMPRFDAVGDSSDHGPFAYRIGVPVINPKFTFNKNIYRSLPTYPAFGALEDTKDYVEKFIDPDYNLHITMAKVVSDVILRISDSAILPFDIGHMVKVVKIGREAIEEYSSILREAGIDSNAFLNTINEFCRIASDFDILLNTINKTALSEFDLYLLNDKLIQLSRAFIADVGIPGQPHYRNVLEAPHPDNLHTDVIFPGIIRTFSMEGSSSSPDILREQVSILIICFNRAIDIIQDGLIT